MKTISAVVVILVVIGLGYVLLGRTSTPDGGIQPINFDTNPMTTPEGLGIETLQQGSGPEAKAGDTVTVHYTGTFLDGTKFDSSVDRGTPFEFTLGTGGVIKGWDLGVAGMKVGEKRLLTVPPELGYGPNDYGPIPGGSTLVFEVELLAIE